MRFQVSGKMDRLDNIADFFKAIIHESETGVADKRLGPRIWDGGIPAELLDTETQFAEQLPSGEIVWHDKT